MKHSLFYGIVFILTILMALGVAGQEAECPANQEWNTTNQSCGCPEDVVISESPWGCWNGSLRIEQTIRSYQMPMMDSETQECTPFIKTSYRTQSDPRCFRCKAEISNTYEIASNCIAPNVMQIEKHFTVEDINPSTGLCTEVEKKELRMIENEKCANPFIGNIELALQKFQGAVLVIAAIAVVAALAVLYFVLRRRK